jgi:hypothetical protein
MSMDVAGLIAVLFGSAAFASGLLAAAQTYRVTNLSALVSGGLVVGMNKGGQMAGNLPTPGNPLPTSEGGSSTAMEP